MVASLSVAGCPSPTTNPSPTASSLPTVNPTVQATPTVNPTAKATATSTSTAAPSAKDKFANTLADQIRIAEYDHNPNVTVDVGGPLPSGAPHHISIDEKWTDSTGEHRIVAIIEIFDNVGSATAWFNNITVTNTIYGKPEAVVNDLHPTHYALGAVTTALGHAPTINKDVPWHYSGDPVAAEEEIQYDNITIIITRTGGRQDPSAPVTP